MAAPAPEYEGLTGDLATPVPEAKGVSYETFYKTHLLPNKPVLLHGLVEAWPACKLWRVSAKSSGDASAGAGDEAGDGGGDGDGDGNGDGDGYGESAVNVSLLSEAYGAAVAPVVTCVESEYGDQPREDMSVADYLRRWFGGAGSGGGSAGGTAAARTAAGGPRYLKDWHFARDFPDSGAYAVPLHMCDDWLNWWWDQRAARADAAVASAAASGAGAGTAAESGAAADAAEHNDYRFLYLGDAGTWTPLHHDVFRSYSWSANVVGRKLWVMFPPSQEGNLKDRHARTLVPDARAHPSVVDAVQFPGYAEACRHRVALVQDAGSVVFVPAGWYHQVHNITDCVSINHNWFNGASLLSVWDFLKGELAAVREAIAHLRGDPPAAGSTLDAALDALDGDKDDAAGTGANHPARTAAVPAPARDRDAPVNAEWEAQCQFLMKANSGTNFAEFADLLARRARVMMAQLEDGSAGSWADVEAAAAAAGGTGSRGGVPVLAAPSLAMPREVVLDGLAAIADVLEDMEHDAYAVEMRRDATMRGTLDVVPVIRRVLADCAKADADG